MFRHTLFPTAFSQKQFDELFDVAYSTTSSYPAVDIYNINNKTVVDVACTGFKESELSVYVDSGILYIEAKRDKTGQSEEIQYRVKKIAKRDFKIQYRIIQHVSSYTAELENGILRITLCSTEEETKQNIKITSK